MTTEHHSVVIVGAGPTGMAAALLLRRYGIDCLVLDRWNDVYPQPRAVHLDDEVYRILDSAGIADDFAKVSRPGRGLRLVDADMRTLAEFSRDPDRRPHGYPQANMFDQPDLERIMRAHLGDDNDVELRGGVDILDVVNVGDLARVDYVEIGTGEHRCLTARYVLGCDGANSTVRSAIGSAMQDLGFEQRWLVVDISTDMDLGLWEGVHQLCDSDRAGTYMRIGPRRYRWEFRLHDDETADTFADLSAILPLVSPWLTAVPEPDLTLIRSTEYTFRAQVADRWRDRRVLLLGDAAHLTPPFIGQGLGAGLRDAGNVVWKLAGVLAGTLPDTALDTYESERKPHATAMIRLAVAIGRAMTGGGSNGDVVRKYLGPTLTRLPILGSKVTDSATPKLAGSEFVERKPLTVRGLAGALCPNAALDTGGCIDDRAPGRFLLLTTTPVTSGQRREIERRGAVVVEVSRSSELGTWLHRGWATAAIVRPDRSVMAASRSVSSLLTRIPSFSPVASAPAGRREQL